MELKEFIKQSLFVKGCVNAYQTNKKRIENIVALLLFATPFLPVFSINNHHDCRTEIDECLHLHYFHKHDFVYGDCVIEAVDKLYFAIAILWYMVIYGSCIVFYHNTNTISPYVVIALIIAVSVWGTFIDPAKWMFVVSLLPSLFLLIMAHILDKKK